MFVRTRPSPRRCRTSFRPAVRPLESRCLPSVSWGGYAQNPEHTGISPVVSQPLAAIHWQTPVDLDPQYSGTDLLIHYGSALVTPANTVIVPVKTGAQGDFFVEGLNGKTGALKWSDPTDYLLPPHDWTPSFSPTLTPADILYFPGVGGTVEFIINPDLPGATVSGRLAFYGLANYSVGLNSVVFINTPLTSDSAGDIFFGFQVTGSNPLGLVSGIARIGADGSGTWIAAPTAAGDATITKVVHNCAPALSYDQRTLYVAVNSGDGTSGGPGYLLALDSTTLVPVGHVLLRDPDSGNPAFLPDDGTASPTIGSDGDVYFGVLENPGNDNHGRGWLLHYSANLAVSKIPGSFGWDDTASLVPAAMVRSYHGPSSYLIMTKYNNYVETGGDGLNRVAVLDPNALGTDPINGVPMMQEVLTVLGPTPDAANDQAHPGAVREWCINTAAVDPYTDSILVNSEDGKLYRWDMVTNTLDQSVTLTSGIGEAYTPTVVGRDGTVYAISNATLFAVGQAPVAAFTVTGTDYGGLPGVGRFSAQTGALLGSFFAYDPHFLGGVRVALGDVNGDGIPDIITGPGLTGGPDVRVYDGATGALIRNFLAYAPGFLGGVDVAAADVNGDGYADIITAADAGGGPHVEVWSGRDGTLLQSFFAYDPRFTGGVRVAAADVNKDGYADVITGAGPGGGPEVRVFSGATGALLQDFMAYNVRFTGGVYVAGGDVDGDGYADVITGAGAGGGPEVRVFSGATGALLQDFMAFSTLFPGGVRVGAANFGADGLADILAGAGPGGGPQVTVFDGTTLTVLDSYFAYDPRYAGGVFVGGF
jgi:hypothetical protein